MKPFFNPDTTVAEKLFSVGKLFLWIGIAGTIFFGPKPYNVIATAILISYILTKDLLDGIKYFKDHTWQQSVAQLTVRILSIIVISFIIHLIFHF